MANSLSFPKEILNMSINTNKQLRFPLSPSPSIFDMMEPPPPPDHNTLSFKELLCTKDFNSNESLFDLFPTITTEDATNTNISFKELLCTKEFN
ncbi:hypothetical protein SESBI_33421 [Sesbania bispinosa]|nr:hypothetical protein SESBI_33421 [Sesbania bispinosa]